MPRDPSRKVKRRAPRRESIDGDLAELVLVLDSNRPNKIGLDGWLSIPWRSGWRAAELPLSLWEAIPISLKRGEAIGASLRGSIMARSAISSTYQQADDFRTQAAEIFVHGCSYAPLLMAAARCIQVEIANSAGGGHVYNDVMRDPLHRLDSNSLLPELEEHVLYARCYDAISTSPQMQNDGNDRERRAFAIAWKRGLYQAAYSIQQVGDS